MNKKVIALVLIFALALCSVFAASTSGTSKKNSFSVGLGVGTNTGVALRYGMGKFDLQGNIGVKFVGGVQFCGDVGGFFNIYDWKFNTGTFTKTQTISFSAGPVCAISYKSNTLGIDVLGVAGAEYTWSDVPVTMFLKLGAGYGMKIAQSSFNGSFAFYGVLGALYTF